MVEPYNNPSSSMLAILSNPGLAEQVLISWVKRHFASYEALAQQPFDRNKKYLRTAWMGFSQSQSGNKCVNVGTLACWSGHQPSNIHRKLKKHKSLFSLFNIEVIQEDFSSPRVQFAWDRQMYRYSRITSTLYLLDPRTVATFLFISKGELCEDFREFVSDSRPELPYNPRRLEATIRKNLYDKS